MRTLTTRQIENLENEKVDILKDEQKRHEGYSIAYPSEKI